MGNQGRLSFYKLLMVVVLAGLFSIHGKAVNRVNLGSEIAAFKLKRSLKEARGVTFWESQLLTKELELNQSSFQPYQKNIFPGTTAYQAFLDQFKKTKDLIEVDSKKNLNDAERYSAVSAAVNYLDSQMIFLENLMELHSLSARQALVKIPYNFNDEYRRITSEMNLMISTDIADYIAFDVVVFDYVSRRFSVRHTSDSSLAEVMITDADKVGIERAVYKKYQTQEEYARYIQFESIRGQLQNDWALKNILGSSSSQTPLSSCGKDMLSYGQSASTMSTPTVEGLKIYQSYWDDHHALAVYQSSESIQKIILPYLLSDASSIQKLLNAMYDAFPLWKKAWESQGNQYQAQQQFKVEAERISKLINDKIASDLKNNIILLSTYSSDAHDVASIIKRVTANVEKVRAKAIAEHFAASFELAEKNYRDQIVKDIKSFDPNTSQEIINKNLEGKKFSELSREKTIQKIIDLIRSENTSPDSVLKTKNLAITLDGILNKKETELSQKKLENYIEGVYQAASSVIPYQLTLSELQYSLNDQGHLPVELRTKTVSGKKRYFSAAKLNQDLNFVPLYNAMIQPATKNQLSFYHTIESVNDLKLFFFSKISTYLESEGKYLGSSIKIDSLKRYQKSKKLQKIIQKLFDQTQASLDQSISGPYQGLEGVIYSSLVGEAKKLFVELKKEIDAKPVVVTKSVTTTKPVVTTTPNPVPTIKIEMPHPSQFFPKDGIQYTVDVSRQGMIDPVIKESIDNRDELLSKSQDEKYQLLKDFAEVLSLMYVGSVSGYQPFFKSSEVQLPDGYVSSSSADLLFVEKSLKDSAAKIDSRYRFGLSILDQKIIAEMNLNRILMGDPQSGISPSPVLGFKFEYKNGEFKFDPASEDGQTLTEILLHAVNFNQSIVDLKNPLDKEKTKALLLKALHGINQPSRTLVKTFCEANYKNPSNDINYQTTFKTALAIREEEKMLNPQMSSKFDEKLAKMTRSRIEKITHIAGKVALVVGLLLIAFFATPLAISLYAGTSLTVALQSAALLASQFSLQQILVISIPAYINITGMGLHAFVEAPRDYRLMVTAKNTYIGVAGLPVVTSKELKQAKAAMNMEQIIFVPVAAVQLGFDGLFTFPQIKSALGLTSEKAFQNLSTGTLEAVGKVALQEGAPALQASKNTLTQSIKEQGLLVGTKEFIKQSVNGLKVEAPAVFKVDFWKAEYQDMMERASQSIIRDAQLLSTKTLTEVVSEETTQAATQGLNRMLINRMAGEIPETSIWIEAMEEQLKVLASEADLVLKNGLRMKQAYEMLPNFYEKFKATLKFLNYKYNPFKAQEWNLIVDHHLSAEITGAERIAAARAIKLTPETIELVYRAELASLAFKAQQRQRFLDLLKGIASQESSQLALNPSWNKAQVLSESLNALSRADQGLMIDAARELVKTQSGKSWDAVKQLIKDYDHLLMRDVRLAAQEEVKAMMERVGSEPTILVTAEGEVIRDPNEIIRYMNQAAAEDFDRVRYDANTAYGPN